MSPNPLLCLQSAKVVVKKSFRLYRYSASKVTVLDDRFVLDWYKTVSEGVRCHFQSRRVDI